MDIEFVCLSLTQLISQKDNFASLSPFVEKSWVVSGRVTQMGMSDGKVNTAPVSKNYNYPHIWQDQNMSSTCGKNEYSCNKNATIKNLWVAARFNPYFWQF